MVLAALALAALCGCSKRRGDAPLGGAILDLSRGLRRDMQTRCDAGHGLDCATLEHIYRCGIGVAPDPARAKALAVLTCRLDTASCQPWPCD